MDRFDPFVKYADVYGDIINWGKDPMNKPQNQNKYFFSDGKTYYEQICKMLRLMSVFKEAFNQIYSNEDEISEAWENFVNNLSASVVEGSEPDVTLTWTDDSVNFEFTMVPGVPGEQGVGITSISFNSDYTMTITLSDGNTYTSMSLKGETGPQGPQGETGSGLQILDVYATLADLQSAHPTGQPGDAYQVGSEGNYILYIWSSSQSAWVQAGTLGTVSPSVSNPLMDGTASAGSLNQYSRGDHVHPTDTSRASKEELDALIKTSQALIDQSFTNRESPAIQDGLARIDKIKGNTVNFNQLVSSSASSLTLINGHKYYTILGGTKAITNGTGQSISVTGETDMVIDLTQMFGAGNEPTTVEEFASLFPLSYYAYDSGSLLSFNGSGIKTTGKNLLPDSEYTTNASGATSKVISIANIPVGIAIISCYCDGILQDYTTTQLQFRKGSTTLYSRSSGASSFSLSNAGDYDNILLYTTGALAGKTVQWQLEYGSTATDFEPYTPSTLSLPISTYFPSGMKSAGNAYDELTPIKAISRIGAVDMGTLNWSYVAADRRFIAILSDAKSSSGLTVLENIISAKYENATWENILTQAKDKIISLHYTSNNSYVAVIDNDYTDAVAYKSAMSGNYLYYELATPVEIAVDLDLAFNAYEDGTEQLLPVNGSVPSTSPIIADMTYLSIDDAMEYIIDKLANVPENTQQILDALEDDVSDLQTDVGALQTSVSGLQTSVGNINTNIGQLSSTVAGHTASISGMQSDISDLNTGLTDLEDTVTDNTSRIGTLETDLASTDGQVQSLGSSVSTLSSTVSNQGTEIGEIDSIIQDISNNPVISALGSHELGFVAAYVDATLPANTGTRVTIPKPTIFPNNYTPLFIVGMSTGAYNVSICEIPPTFGNSDSVNCRVWNHGSQQTTQITVYILCMRQRQSQ